MYYIIEKGVVMQQHNVFGPLFRPCVVSLSDRIFFFPVIDVIFVIISPGGTVSSPIPTFLTLKVACVISWVAILLSHVLYG